MTSTVGQVIGVDAGGTRLKAGIIDQEGNIQNALEVKSPRERASLEAAFKDLLTTVAAGRSIRAVGIGSKGMLNEQGSIAWSPPPNEYLKGLSYPDLAREVFPEAAVAIDNDARVALVGEMMWGAARGKRHVLLSTIGTHIGGAILANGEIIRGARRRAGMIGHQTITFGGETCGCGNKGCLRTEFCAESIERKTRKALKEGAHSALGRFVDTPQALTCKDVFDAARDGDPLASKIVSRGIRKFAAVLAGLANLLDTEIIIIGGQVAEAGDILFGPLRKDIWERTRGTLGEKVPVVPAVTGSSGIIGAGALAYQLLK